MGALCCVVASRPQVTTKPPASSGRDISSLSQDDVLRLQWRTNLSFSPGAYTRDGLEQDMSDESHGFALCSSRSRLSKSLESCFQQSPRCDSNSSASGTGLVNSIPRSNSSKHQSLNEEKDFDRESKAISQSFRSLLSLTESTAHCSYPRVFCNPVSDCENHELGHTQKDTSTNPDPGFMMSTRNHQDSQVEEALPKLSSNDMLLDTEKFNETELGSMTHQRCGICKKLLSQKSPWCSYKILRCGDKPVAGVFPCHHVYHVECLDKVTPTAQTRDPLCPVCSNTIGAMERPLIEPETLQMALRSLRRSHTALETEPLSSSCNDNQRRNISRRSQKLKKLNCCLNISFSSSSRNPT